jgi:flagellar hook-associated protein 2
MTISFSGLASGLDTSSWVEALVSIKQQKVTTLQSQLTAYQTTKSTLTDTKSTMSSLRNALEKITDAKFGGTFDLFTKNTATSSNTDVFTATATSDATKQSYDIAVQQLATYTKASSLGTASAVADDSTELSNLGITTGSLTVYVDGVKNAINIEDGDTLGDLKSRLAAAGVKAEVDESGMLNLSAYDSNKSVNVGATTDSSNFVSLIGLTKQEDGSYQSTNSLFKANTATKLTSENSGFNQQITAGTFTIGDATFTINDKTTLSSLISQINNSDDAQAYAYWDDATGKLSITSKKEGASYINIEAGTSNFTDVMGFTETTRDADGNVISSKMYTDAQELGQNAIFTVNGTSITSTSNTVTSDISRISGVTLTLKKASSEDDGTSTLKIEQDTTDLVSAVKSLVEAYNTALSKITEVTASGADLQRESSLTSLKNTIRNYANGNNTYNGGSYSLLSQLGISTGSADANNLSTDTYSLKFDEDTFLQALQDDPESVKSLLAGDNGILNQIENTVEQSLKASVGYFDIKESTLNSNISSMETKISKQQTKVDNYQSQLETKFSNMELLISQMQQNYSSFLSS